VVVDESVPSSGVGDGRRIAQVVRTLVHNAFKFTEHGRVDVHVTAPTADEAETWVQFDVIDTGIGIAEEQLPTLFQPFVQADPHVSGDRQGNGLGLAIASELAELMHGRLRVASVLGEGSTFTFGAPLGRAGSEGSDR
jgi:signal transduction histidine kinase